MSTRDQKCQVRLRITWQKNYQSVLLTLYSVSNMSLTARARKSQRAWLNLVKKGTWKWDHYYWGDYLAPDRVFYWGGGATQQVWQNIWLWTRTAARPKGISVRGKSLKRPIASTRLLTWWEVRGVDRRWQVLLLSFVTCFPPQLFQPVDFNLLLSSSL